VAREQGKQHGHPLAGHAPDHLTWFLPRSSRLRSSNAPWRGTRCSESRATALSPRRIAPQAAKNSAGFSARTPRGVSLAWSSVLPDGPRVGAHPQEALRYAGRAKLAMEPIAAMLVAACSGLIPGIEVRMRPAREVTSPCA